MNPYTKNKITDVSLYFFAASEEHHDTSDKYELLLKGAKFADENDLLGIWIPERHFTNFGDRFPNPSVCAGAIAATTNRIRIRSGSVVLPLHDPIRVAEEWSVVDNLSNGRIELGAASGWHPDDFVLAPQNFAIRHQKMCENLEEIKALWAGKPIARVNGQGKECKIKTYPQPVQEKLPVWITAAAAAETFRFAGSIGAKVITNLLLQSRDELKSKIDIYYKSLIEHGFDVEDGKVAIMIHTFMSEDPAFTERTVKEPFKAYIGHFTELLRPIAQQSNLNIDRGRGLMIEMGFQRYYHSSGLFGSLKKCLERVEEMKACGVSEVACLIDFGIDTQCTLDHLPNIAKLRREIMSEELK